MTVTYTAEVATCKGLGCFLKLLRRWKGSIYKLVWIDLLLFLSIYYTLNCVYRFLLDKRGKQVFEALVQYCNDYSTLIPLSFVLGFYVSIVMTRWWNQYTSIPFPDPLAVFVSATVHGQDERGRVMRRTIMRYVCLSVTIVFSMISPRVKKRFPTLDHLVEAGLLHQSEKAIMSDLDLKFPKHSKYWLPLIWAASIVTRARKEGRIRDDFAVKTMLDELNKFRGQCGLLLSYDFISVPLVYTQVVTLAVYSYFFISLFGHQWVEGNKYKFDLYLPVFLMLQFFFYVGWLKVAETLINPFGDDDDDFEINWMIDRNLQISYLIVDEMHHDHPELVRDQYWDEVFPQELPHTLASEPFRDQHPQPSTANIAVKGNQSEISAPSSLKIDDMNLYNDMNSGPIMFSAKPENTSGNLTRSRGSQSSMGTSVPDAMTRVNSVTNALKRLFSKDDSKQEKMDGKTPSRGASSVELQNIGSNSVPKTQPGSMRITDQVIEEVDEQLTINSHLNAGEPRPSIMNVFGPPPPSKPVPVPYMSESHRSEPANFNVDAPSPPHPLSKSAPEPASSYEFSIPPDKISIGGSDTDNSDDEFNRLKNLRQEERMSRLKLNLARSVSSNAPQDETQMLLHDSTNGLNVPPSSTSG